jgi:hypothetical protein
MSILNIEKSYPFLYAEHLETKYGTSVLLTIRESTDNVIKVFLRRRYSVVFTEDYLIDINEKTV